MPSTTSIIYSCIYNTTKIGFLATIYIYKLFVWIIVNFGMYHNPR